MGVKSTCSLAVFVGALAIPGSVRPGAAQDFSPQDPLAIRMPADAQGVWVDSVVAIAIRLGVPLGFEEAGAADDHVRGPFVPLNRGKRIVSVRQRPLDLGGLTLREALEAVAAEDHRYEWKTIDGVLVVRPVASWRDPYNPLLRPVSALQSEIPPLAGSADSTLLDRLNATARARRGFHWVLASSSSLVQLDRGRAVEVVAPELRLGDETGESTFSITWR